MAEVKITQVRSTIGARWNQRESLRTLGLRKIRQSVVREDNAQTRGLIKAVHHLVKVEPAGEFLRTLDLRISVGRPDWISKIIDILKEIPTDVRDTCVDNLRELTGEVRFSMMSLTWEEVRKAQSCGISFGSHSMTHPILTLLGDEALEREIQISREIIESMTGASCRLLAYPNGDHDDRVRAAAQRAGYRWAVTMERGRNGPGTNPLALRRHPVYAHYSQPLFAAILRGWLDLPPWVFRLVNKAMDHKVRPSMFPNRII